MSTTYQSQAYELELYTIPPNDSAQSWADWISRTEKYLLQEHPWAVPGRGANLQVVVKPLIAPKTGYTWKKGKPAFWEQLQVRRQMALEQPAQHHRPHQGLHDSTPGCPQTDRQPGASF